MILSKKNKAFTLIELLVVIAIIGVLAALALTNYNASRRNARDGRRLGDIRNIMTALEQYYNDNGAYPIVEPGGVSSVFGGNWLTGLAPTYMDRVPLDPTNFSPGCLHYSYYSTPDCYSSAPGGCYRLQYGLERRDDSKAIGNPTNETCPGVRKRYEISR